MSEQTKTCGGGCGRDLPLTSYSPRKDRPSGYRSECRDCARAAMRERDARKLLGAKDLQALPFQPTADLHRAWQSVRVPVYEASNFGTYRLSGWAA